MTLPSLRLKANADRRLRAGHLWVYSNEVDTAATPGRLRRWRPGHPRGRRRQAAGHRRVSPNNLICARLLSRDLAQPGQVAAGASHPGRAALRERLFDQPCYRLIYGDSDLLPGLVVDRFHDHRWCSWLRPPWSATRMPCWKRWCRCSPRGVLWKNDSSARDAEGLERYVDTAFGVVPEWVALEENGVKFEAPVLQGQKTGWFYDHRNRARLAPYVKGKRVLDLFSYIGGWACRPRLRRQRSVLCRRLGLCPDGVERNAALNGVAEKMTCVEGDAFEAMKELKNAEERFDVVITDPPAFIKRKKDLKNGEAAYRRLNETAMRLLNKDGILVSASCSMHLPEDDLQNILLGSARHLDRNIQLLERGAQGPDHPVHPAIPETRYIKSLTCRILPNS